MEFRPGRPLAGAGLVPLLLLLLLALFGLVSGEQQAASRSSEPEIEKVAAFASRLEQWFACRRANQLSELQLLLAANRAAGPQEAAAAASAAVDDAAVGAGRLENQAARCEAHFDGHLCWPASKAGERLKLACPRSTGSLVSHARGGQEARIVPAVASAEVRSVINSLQPLATDNQIEPRQQAAAPTPTTNQSFVLGAPQRAQSQPQSQPQEEEGKFGSRRIFALHASREAPPFVSSTLSPPPLGPRRQSRLDSWRHAQRARCRRRRR